MLFNDYQIAQDMYPEYTQAIEFSKKQWETVPTKGKAVVVNVPAAQVWLIDNGKRVGVIKAIIGKIEHQTPLLSNSIQYIELNPKWFVPDTIAVRDLVPKILKRPDMISKYGYKFFDRKWKPVDSKTVNLKDVTKGHWNYRIVQDPGWSNAMGQIKFMFPNKEHVYLHDTPNKLLFKRATENRTLSSGCIRLEKPFELAKFLIDRDLYAQAQQRKPEDIVHLKEPIPLRIVYMPIWVDQNLDVNFGYDFYHKLPKAELPKQYEPDHTDEIERPDEAAKDNG